MLTKSYGQDIYRGGDLETIITKASNELDRCDNLNKRYTLLQTAFSAEQSKNVSLQQSLSFQKTISAEMQKVVVQYPVLVAENKRLTRKLFWAKVGNRFIEVAVIIAGTLKLIGKI